MKIKNQIFLIISICYSALLFAANDFPACPKLDFSHSITFEQLAADYKCAEVRNLKQEMADNFNFKGRTDEEAQEYLTQFTLECFRALRECKPGNYSTLVYNDLFKVKISGIRNDLCIVDMTTEHKNMVLPTETTINTEHCKFERVNLLIFTDDAAEITTAFTDEKVKQKILGNQEMYTRAKQTLDAVQKNFRRYCKDVATKKLP